MKKYRCPHCGEFSFNFFHKTIRKDGRVGRLFRDNLYFVCGKCGKPVEHKASKSTKKICSFLIPSLLILLVLFMALAIFELFNAMFFVFAIISCIKINFNLLLQRKKNLHKSKLTFMENIGNHRKKIL